MYFRSVIYEVLFWLVLETVLLPTDGPKEQTQRGTLKSPERQASPLAKITQYQLADWKGRLPILQSDGPCGGYSRTERKPKGEQMSCVCMAVTTQGKKGLFCFTVQEDVIHHGSRGCLLGSPLESLHLPWSGTLFQQLQPEVKSLLSLGHGDSVTNQGRVLSAFCSQGPNPLASFRYPDEPCNSKLGFGPLPSWSPWLLQLCSL